MSGRWELSFIRPGSGEGGSFSCVRGGSQGSPGVLTTTPPIMTALKTIMRKKSPKGQTYIVAMAMSLSRRLSLVNLGAAGNSIKLGQLRHGASLFGGEKFLQKLIKPFWCSSLPTSQHWGYTCTESSPLLFRVPGLGPIFDGDGMVWDAPSGQEGARLLLEELAPLKLQDQLGC